MGIPKQLNYVHGASLKKIIKMLVFSNCISLKNEEKKIAQFNDFNDNDTGAVFFFQRVISLSGGFFCLIIECYKKMNQKEIITIKGQ